MPYLQSSHRSIHTPVHPTIHPVTQGRPSIEPRTHTHPPIHPASHLHRPNLTPGHPYLPSQVHRHAPGRTCQTAPYHATPRHPTPYHTIPHPAIPDKTMRDPAMHCNTTLHINIRTPHVSTLQDTARQGTPRQCHARQYTHTHNRTLTPARHITTYSHAWHCTSVCSPQFCAHVQTGGGEVCVVRVFRCWCWLWVAAVV